MSGACNGCGGQPTALFGAPLADHVLIELVLDGPWGWRVAGYRAAGGAPALFLFDDRSAQLNAFTTDEYVGWAFHQRTDIAVAFTAERARSVTRPGTTTGWFPVAAAGWKILSAHAISRVPAGIMRRGRCRFKPIQASPSIGRAGSRPCLRPATILRNLCRQTQAKGSANQATGG